MDALTENDEKFTKNSVIDPDKIFLKKTFSSVELASKQQKEKVISKHRRRLPKKYIFSYYNIKKLTKKIALPKFLVRLFLKYNEPLSSIQPLKKYNEIMTKNLNSQRKNNFDLADIREICGVHLEWMPEINSLNRKLLWNIIRSNQC